MTQLVATPNTENATTHLGKQGNKRQCSGPLVAQPEATQAQGVRMLLLLSLGVHEPPNVSGEHLK